jgi:hypothetical protein
MQVFFKLFHNSSASHRPFAALLIRLAGGEVIAGREGGVCGKDGAADCNGHGWRVSGTEISGGVWAPAAVVVRPCLRQCQRYRLRAGAKAATGDAMRR